MKPGALIEKWYPTAFGVVVGLVYFIILKKYILTSGLKDSFSTILTISSVGVGFLASAKSILLSLNHSEIIRRLRKAGYYANLVHYLLNALWLCFATMIVSGILFFSATPEMATRFIRYRDFTLSVWLGLVVVSAASCFRACHLFSKCLKYASKETK